MKNNRNIVKVVIDLIKIITELLISFLVLTIKVSNDINKFKTDNSIDMYYIFCIFLMFLSIVFISKSFKNRRYDLLIHIMFLVYSIYSLLNPYFN